MDELDLAYFAGFFDGEGSVTGSVVKTTRGKRPRFRIEVGGSDLKPLLDKLKEAFGGSVHLNKPAGHKQKGGPTTRRDFYVWSADHRIAESFADTILPYARTKRRHLEVFLAVRRTYAHTGGTPLTSETIEMREWAVWELHRLNSKSRHDRKGLTKCQRPST